MREYEFLSKPLFTLEEAKSEFNSEDTAYGALRRAIDRHEVKKLTGGLYCTLDPSTRESYVSRYEIGCALHQDAYCAYRTALEYYGLVKPGREVQMISPRQTAAAFIDGVEYKTFTCGYNEGVAEDFDLAPVRVTDLERTMVDCLDRPSLCGGLMEVFKALCKVGHASEGKLLKYLEGYDVKILYKKVGYIMSVINPSYLSADFVRICKERSSTREDDIRPSRDMKSIYSKDWNLHVPYYISKKYVPRTPKAKADAVPSDGAAPSEAAGAADASAGAATAADAAASGATKEPVDESGPGSGPAEGNASAGGGPAGVPAVEEATLPVAKREEPL